MKIDLHTHSQASDGTETPAELIKQAHRVGLDVIALTDHDTTAGWDPATVAAKEVGVGLIYGAEFSTSANQITTHLLGYGFNPADSTINQLFDQVKKDRRERLQEITDRVNQVYPITWEEVLKQVPAQAAVGRPHLADALVKKGYFPDRDQVFASILRTDSPFYVRYRTVEPVVVCQAVKAAGGVPVLAHPLAKKRQRRFLNQNQIATLVEAGLWGIEVRHPEQAPQDQEEVARMARELGLEQTGASDYHGKGKRNRLGECLTPWETVEKLLAQCQYPWLPPRLAPTGPGIEIQR